MWDLAQEGALGLQHFRTPGEETGLPALSPKENRCRSSPQIPTRRCGWNPGRACGQHAAPAHGLPRCQGEVPLEGRPPDAAVVRDDSCREAGSCHPTVSSGRAVPGFVAFTTVSPAIR